MNKNGFVFVETIIVIVVLVTVLLIIYSGYAGLVSQERRIDRYDDANYVYKSYNISKFLNTLTDYNGNSVIRNKIDSHDFSNPISIQKTDNSLFVNNPEKEIFFSNVLENLHVKSIYIFNKEYIKNIYNLKSSELNLYLKSLDTENFKNINYFYVIVYAETNDGNKCSINSLVSSSNQNPQSVYETCTFYYTYIPISL